MVRGSVSPYGDHEEVLRVSFTDLRGIDDDGEDFGTLQMFLSVRGRNLRGSPLVWRWVETSVDYPGWTTVRSTLISVPYLVG